jgi:hypothetical protein
MRFNTLLISAAATLALGAGCTSSTSSDTPAEPAHVVLDAPHDAAKAGRVAQAEIVYGTAIKKADGDRNFAISKCTTLAGAQAMPCMTQADAEFAAASDRAKSALEMQRM